MEVLKQTAVELKYGFNGPDNANQKKMTFRRPKAGDLKTMDNKGEHEGLQAFAAAITNTTPGMIADLDFEDYAIVMKEVRRFLSIFNINTAT